METTLCAQEEEEEELSHLHVNAYQYHMEQKNGPALALLLSAMRTCVKSLLALCTATRWPCNGNLLFI